MKKTLLLLSIFAGFAFGASAQCTPDTTGFATGVYLNPVSLPCVHQGIAYSNTQTVKVPDSISYTLPVVGTTVQGYVDSIRIDSISGYPTGLSSASSPALGTWILHGGFACALFTGTTTAPVGGYALAISGRACGHFNLPALLGGGVFDTCTSYTFTKSYPDTITVCYPAGISDVSAGVDLNIYPNPNQGNFTVTISSASQINGTLSVVDALGRTINTQNIEVSGTKQVPLEMSNLSPGAYLLMINAAGARSVKQFIVK
jgi:hypothetical protein